jgi:hypothetical protein
MTSDQQHDEFRHRLPELVREFSTLRPSDMTALSKADVLLYGEWFDRFLDLIIPEQQWWREWIATHSHHLVQEFDYFINQLTQLKTETARLAAEFETLLPDLPKLFDFLLADGEDE